MFVNFDLNIIITDVISTVRLVNFPVNTSNTRTNRENWAVALKTGGKTIYNINGMEILSDKTHLVILPKGSSYTWQCVDAGECILIEFQADSESKDIFSFDISDNSIITKAYIQIEKLLNIKTPGYKTECIAIIYGVLLHLLKSSRKYTPKDKKDILQPAIEYISENYYKNDITNDTLASLCKISTVYFRKTFENVYGIPPIRYLNNLRIDKAKSMLSSDFESIQQVAESIGYSSIYHFSKMFKQYTGISPSEYKKTHLN